MGDEAMMELEAPQAIDAFIEKFLRLIPADGAASPRTLKVYRQAIATYAGWCSSRGLDPMRAGNDDVMAYRADQASQYKRSTVKLRLTAVRLVYVALQRWGARPDNPAAGVRAPKAKESETTNVLIKALTPEQAKAFLAMVESAPARDRAMLRLMVFHGLRAGEISALTTDNLVSGGSALTFTGKGNKIRTLILSKSCAQDLASIAPGPLFRSSQGGGLSVRSVERIVDDYLTRCGLKIPGRSAHGLRHTSAILSVLGGAKREALAQALGHASIATTDTYIRAAWQMQENPVDAVERALAQS